MKARAHVHVHGWVQGVFFRYHTKEVADEHGVKGWVRNLPDGRVEAVLEGDREQVEKVLEFCRRGPPGAEVDDVEVKWENYSGEFSKFEVKYW